VLQPPPLTLYVHLPWCVRKCPYCDFNSHGTGGRDIPEQRYVEVLLADLERLRPAATGRLLGAVFFGGGTPSLFSAAALERLLETAHSRVGLAPGAEITLEANPGSVEHDRFGDYRAAGVNRVSLGVQSFDDTCLRQLGRIHDAADAHRAIGEIAAAGFDNFNLDLMYGLPGQDVAGAVADVERALSHEPAHLSHYHLTIEPQTVFAADPPTLPDEERIEHMQTACGDLLQAAGLERYEVSAWARPGRACRHNLNYWRFGDYLAIGAGAHGKLTNAAAGSIKRYARTRSPALYMRAPTSGNWLAESRELDTEDRVFEFFLNGLRLAGGIRLQDFVARTGLPEDAAAAPLARAAELGLIKQGGGRVRPSARGWRFLDDLQGLFLSEPSLGTGRI